MFTQIIAWSGLLIQATLLLRAWQQKFLHVYSLFYIYIAAVLVQDLLRLAIIRLGNSYYFEVYWYTELFSVLLGCLTIFELYRQALKPFSGVARLAKTLLLVVFALAISRIIANLIFTSSWSPDTTILQVELDLRIIQTTFLVGLILLFRIYEIKLGGNVRGLTWGYAFFLGTSIINLTLRDRLGDSFHTVWTYIQPLSYFAVLLIWCAALWKYAPQPAPKLTLEEDYQVAAERSRKKLAELHAYVTKAARP